MKPPPKPARILMLKGHSAGIGDILRSSAAWRILKNTYPGGELHLLFLTREPGYPSEELIRQHHLLSSFTAIDKRTRSPRDWRKFWGEVQRVARAVRPDLVIDFESNGIRTSLVAAWLALRWRAKTIGIRAAAGRNLFYGRSAPSRKEFARERGLPWPINYADRDFVALAALGLERNNCPIELRETEAGRKFRESLRRNFGLAESTPLLGVNIGCGTADAVYKRPEIEPLSELVAGLQRAHGLRLFLTGSPGERHINEEFIVRHRQRSSEPVIDLAGKTNMSELTGAINASRLFISSDSGPYHMAVALGVPTLAIFRNRSLSHFHYHPWVRCHVTDEGDDLTAIRQAAEELLAIQRPSNADSGSA